MEGMIVLTWDGTSGLVYCTASTYQRLLSNDSYITVLQEAQGEAKRVMPTAVVRDLAAEATQPVPAVPRATRPAANTVGQAGLRQQIVHLVEDMAKFASPDVEQQAAFARRYGKLRDRMADLRAEFIAAEGAFEVAQAALLKFMED